MFGYGLGHDEELPAGFQDADLEMRELEDKAKEEDECPHDEHDHGICLDCGKDIWDDVVAAAEFRADCLENI